jgi:hypothetical protein
MNQKQFPVTIEEAVGVVVATLADEDQAKIAAMAESALIGLHFGLGLWIRNNFGLWQEPSALLDDARRLDPSIGHPDDASMLIIAGVWKRLQEMAPKVH